MKIALRRKKLSVKPQRSPMPKTQTQMKMKQQKAKRRNRSRTRAVDDGSFSHGGKL